MPTRLRLAAAPVATAAVLAAAPAAPAATVRVSTEPALQRAVAAARPGTEVVIAPGTYRLTDRIRLGPAQSGSARRPVVIRAQAPGRVTIDAAGQEEAFYVPGGAYVRIQGLRITGGAYHAVKVDAPAHHVVIAGNRMWDNTRAGSDGQASAVKGGGQCAPLCAARVTVERNVITQVAPFGGNNLQGIDCNACDGWVVRRNVITGIRGAALAGTGSSSRAARAAR